MTSLEIYAGLGVSLGLGFLIGLQRQRSVPAGFAGVRTYSLAALLGAACALLSRAHGAWTIGAGFVALLVFLTVNYLRESEREEDRGITSEVAFLLTYALGALALSPDILSPAKERYLLTAAIGVAAGALLSFKGELHAMARRVSQEDMVATAKFAVLAIIILPLLPDKSMGPWGVINPSKIGLLIVLIAGISFAGYLAIRVLGPGRGLGVIGLLGGLASSTAVTLSLSGRAKADRDAATPCAMAIVLASSVMAPRVIAEVAVVNPSLVPWVAWPMGCMMAGGLVAAIILHRLAKKAAEQGDEVRFSNPFELGSALKMGAIFIVVLVVATFAQKKLGTAGVYAAAALAGLTDVDAITLSMARLAREGLDPRQATLGILIGAASNTIVKAVMTVVLGGWVLGRRTLPAFAALLLGGAAGAAVLWLR